MRSSSKTLTRQEHLDALECTREEDTEKFCSFVSGPKVQADLEIVKIKPVQVLRPCRCHEIN